MTSTENIAVGCYAAVAGAADGSIASRRLGASGASTIQYVAVDELVLVLGRPPGLPEDDAGQYTAWMVLTASGQLGWLWQRELRPVELPEQSGFTR